MFENFILTLYSPKFLDGTATRTRSGEVRWSCRNLVHAVKIQDHERYCRHIMNSEPGFNFAPYAVALSSLPESRFDGGGAKWNSTLSLGAKAYLSKLRKLERRNPVAAIKLAAIATAMTDRDQLLNKKAVTCLLAWMGHKSLDRVQRTELACLLCEGWPDDVGIELELMLGDMFTEAEQAPRGSAHSELQVRH